MGKLVSLKIDVSKIDKAKDLYKGAKGTYLTVTVSLNDQIDLFGNNVSCWVEQTQAERTAKAERKLLGNGRVVFDDQRTTGSSGAPSVPSEDDDLPF